MEEHTIKWLLKRKKDIKKISCTPGWVAVSMSYSGSKLAWTFMDCKII